MSVWENVLLKRRDKIKEICKIIPEYCYSAEDLAHMTDEKLCKLIVDGLHVAKERLFNITQTEFELHRDLLSKEFQELRDSVDTFSDEVKCRHFDWDKDSTEKWLECIIDHDYRIIMGLLKLNRELEDVIKNLREGSRDTEKRLEIIEKQIKELVINFKERDVICNIKEIALERTFQKVRAEMRG